MGDKLNKRISPTIGVSEYARIVGLSRPTIYAYINEGLILPLGRKVTKKGATRYILSREEALSIKAELNGTA